MPSSLQQAVRSQIEARADARGFYETAAPGLVLMRADCMAMPRHTLYRPALCVVVEGAKQLRLGERIFDYKAGQALVVSLDLPAVGYVTTAPFIGLNLDLDPVVLRDILAGIEVPPGPAEPRLGLIIVDVDEALADSFARLVGLLDRPEALAMLYPSIMREICYWLLAGPHGAEIVQAVLSEGHTQRIARALRILRENFTRPIRVAELAEAAHMSPSSFHQHFKTVTAMTPLQYQKQLRLIEARRLLASEPSSVAHAAYKVGYESTSQFSREYTRMFGTPPKRHAGELAAATAS